MSPAAAWCSWRSKNFPGQGARVYDPQHRDRQGRNRTFRGNSRIALLWITEPRSETLVGNHPLLSNRRNIVVIAGEAHRSQYDFIDGFACLACFRG